MIFAGANVPGSPEEDRLSRAQINRYRWRQLGPGGIYICIEHAPERHVVSCYMHLDTFTIAEGDAVKAGQEIGRVGRTGVQVSPPHLHFEIRVDDRVTRSGAVARGAVHPPKATQTHRYAVQAQRTRMARARMEQAASPPSQKLVIREPAIASVTPHQTGANALPSVVFFELGGSTHRRSSTHEGWFVLSNRFSRPTRFAGARALALFVVGVLVICGAARPAWAEDAPGIDRLSKQALEAFDGLNFDQAKTLLEKAISEGEASGLEHDPSVARAHLDLGMLLIAGFQKRDEAIEQFKAALAIQPAHHARPPASSTPRSRPPSTRPRQSVKSEQEAAVRGAGAAAAGAPGGREAGKSRRRRRPRRRRSGGGGGARLLPGPRVSGRADGIAKGDLDTNKGLFQNGRPRQLVVRAASPPLGSGTSRSTPATSCRGTCCSRSRDGSSSCRGRPA